MKILLDIPEDKVSFIMEVLENFSFVKAKQLSVENEDFYEGLKEAVEEVNELKEGKKKRNELSEFLNEQ